MRLHHIQTMKQAGETVYPHKYHVSIALRDFIDKYSHLKNEEIHEDVVSVAGKIEQNFDSQKKNLNNLGRIYSKRSSGTKLYFYDLHSDSVKVQVMANLK